MPIIVGVEFSAYLKPVALPLLPAHEKELLQQLKEGDENALALLYKEHWQSLFLSAYNILKDKKACEDIVQELFLQLWLKRETLAVRESLKTYLSTAARYQVFHHVRKAAKGFLLTGELSDSSIADHPDEALLQKDLHHQVRKAVSNLPEKCQQIYRLSREEHLSHKEISLRLNISVKTVENQLTIALRRLRHFLQDYSIINLLLLSLAMIL